MAVEGFFGVFKLYQNGNPNAVALMGSMIGSRQASADEFLDTGLPGWAPWVASDWPG
jgi:hypothetical protein